MPGKRATKSANLLKKETFNDIQSRLERLEAAIRDQYKRDHDSQLLVRNNASSDWLQFSVVTLSSPLPTTGTHFNGSKLFTAAITPDAHTYDPSLLYAVVQYKVSKVSNSVPGVGPGVVTGLTNALFVSGADDSKKYAFPSTESGKFDTTDDPTLFKLIGIDAATDVGKIIILGNANKLSDCTSVSFTETQMVSTDSVGCVGFRMRTKTVYINADGCLEETDGDWSDTIDLATCGSFKECCPDASSSIPSSYSEGECCATFTFGDYIAGTQGDLVIENHSATPTYLEGGTTFTISWDVRNASGDTVDTWVTLTWDNETELDNIAPSPAASNANPWICANQFSAFAFNRCVIWKDQSFAAGETKSYSVTMQFNCHNNTSASDDLFVSGAIIADGFGVANPDGSANPIHPARQWTITETACSSTSTSGPGSSSASAPP